MSNHRWIKNLFGSPKKVRLYERERVLIDATETICQVMREQNVNRGDLAHRLNVTPANITQILSGKRNLTLRTLSDVFVALGHSLLVASAPLASERGWTLTHGWKKGDRLDCQREQHQATDSPDEALVA